MPRNFKVLGLVLTVVLAMAASSVSSASADYLFTSGVSATISTGSQVGNNTFTTAGQTIQCTTTTFSGTGAGKETKELTITPTITGCTYASGAKTVDVTFNGCTVVITGATQASGHGIAHIACPAGKAIELHLTNFNGSETCTVTVGTQTPTEGYTAVNSGEHVNITVTQSMKLTPHGKGGCPLLVSGKYSGTLTVEGFEDISGAEGKKVKLAIDS